MRAHLWDVSKMAGAVRAHWDQATQKKRAADGDPELSKRKSADQPFTLSFRAFAMVILTTLSASLWICSPVAGLRTMRAGRSRQ